MGVRCNKFSMMMTGALLASLGTLMAFFVYVACHDFQSKKAPVLTHMYGEWKFAGGMTTGIGVTLLGSGVLATAVSERDWLQGYDKRHGGKSYERVFWIVVVAKISLWSTMTTSNLSNDFNLYIHYIHVISAALLMTSNSIGTWMCFQFILEAIKQLEDANDEKACKPCSKKLLYSRSLLVAAQHGLLIFMPMCLVSAGIGVLSSNNLLLCVAEISYFMFSGIWYFVAFHSFLSAHCGSVQT
jgi:hypothetical protein